MMAVVVDHRHTVDASLELETAINAAEVRKSFADLLDRNVETYTNGESGGCIADVVFARYVQSEFAQAAAVIAHAERTRRHVAFAGGSALHVADEEIGAITRAVSDNATAYGRQHAAQIFVVIAGNHHAVERNVVEEIDEGSLDVGHIAVAIHMLATAMPYFRRISSASISARGITGMWLAWAAATSGLSRAIAELMTTTSAPAIFSARCPSLVTAPMEARRCVM